jgi:hypothetical protein
VAFLLLDTTYWSAFADAAVWDSGYAFPSRRRDKVDVSLIGYSRRSTSRVVKGSLMGPQITLRALGSFPPWIAGGDRLPVVELDDPNHTGQIIYGGDSGAPIFVGEKVVALAAGFIDLRTGESRRIPFAVPAKEPVPAEGQMQPLPLRGTDPYASLPITRSIWKAFFAGVPVSPQVEPCMDAIDTSMGEYDGRREEMPSLLGKNTQPFCQRIFLQLRKEAITEERDARVGRELRASSEFAAALELEARTLEARTKRDQTLLRALEGKQRDDFAGLLSVGRAPVREASAIPRGRARDLEVLAEQYERSAMEARWRQVEILRTGALPTTASPSGQPPESAQEAGP